MEMVGLDHLYVTVSDFARSEEFYDALMKHFGFRKSDTSIGGEPHAHYFNPHIQYTIRPAHSDPRSHDPYAPGVHHICFQAPDRAPVDEAFRCLQHLGLEPSPPREYPEYAPGYYATFFSDPDGIRLEVVARTSVRDEIARNWSQFTSFLNPVSRFRERRTTGAARRGAGS